LGKWPRRGECAIQDFWREIKAATRKYCMCWGANTQSQLKRISCSSWRKLTVLTKRRN
jgi:hypothetical protein